MLNALLLLLALQSQDPVQVGARLTDQEIHAGETTVLRVDVETEGERARIGRFRTLPPGIEVVGTRDYDQRQFSLPGGTRRFVTREFVLRARTAGRYRIPSLTVEVDGRVYGTQSLLLTVTSAPARERGETRGGEDGVVLRAWLDADTVFVGEQVTLEVEAMFSQEARMRLRRAPEYEAPSPSGVWVHDLPDPGRPVSRSIGDELYEVQRFRRAFFPLSAGRITVPPARLEYEVRRGLLYSPETRELTSDPLTLVVRAIPTAQPPGFTGAVGEYTLRARIEPASVPVGEAAVLTVVVEGTGNVKALPPPELPELPGVDVFPPSEEAVTEPRGTTVQGQKTFSWVLIPRQAGTTEIPSIRYAFFDPDDGEFETSEVAPLTLRATPAPAAADELPPATLRFLKTSSETDPLAWVRSWWFAALQVLPLLLLASALLWRRRRRGGTSPGALRRQRRQTVRELRQRADDLEDTELFADAERFAREWIRQRVGVAPTADALADAGVPDDAAGSVRAVLDRLSAARYAPEPPGPTVRRSLMDALDRALEAVDAGAPRAAETGAAEAAGVAGIALAVLMGGLAWPVPAAAQDAPEPAADPEPAVETEAAAETSPATLFQRGLEAFQADDYGRAVRAFDRYTRRAPDDPAGWYNLGTSYHRAGQEGYGVWAWLRAVRLDPRDGDSRHNLRVAGVAPELVRRATPALPLRASELMFLAGLLWLLGGAAGAVWLLRRGRGAGVTAVVGVALALAVAGAWWDSTRGAETLIVLDHAALRAGPALRSEPVASLEPGAGLVPVDRYGDWVRARTLAGEEGWIEGNRTGSL